MRDDAPLPEDKEPQRFDSGYTPEELDAILASLTAGQALTGEDATEVALEVGLSDGDVTWLSRNRTVLLSTPRVTIDANVELVRRALAAGQSMAEALLVLD